MIAFYLKLEHKRWAISEQFGGKSTFPFVFLLLFCITLRRIFEKVSFDIEGFHWETVNLGERNIYCVVILNFWIWSSHYKMHCSLITNPAERDKVGSSCGILAMAISFLQGRAADFIVHLCLFFLLIHVTELSLKFLSLKNFSCHSIIYLMSRFTTKAGCISSYSSLCCLSLYKVYSFGCLLLWQMCTGGTSW